MIPNAFAYVAPTSAPEAVEVLAGDPEGTLPLGGGTWVVPDMNRGTLRPRRVVDLRRAGLGGIARVGRAIRIGATCTYADVLASPLAREHLPLLARMAAGVTGGRQLTQQGTLGGSAVAARPQSDVPAAIVALGAEATVLGPAGERRLAAAALFAGAQRSALAPGELLTGFELPSAGGHGYGYVKLKRGGSSWPIATAAAIVELDEAGACRAATLVLGGVCATPTRVDLAALAGRPPTEDALDEAAHAAAGSVREPFGDVLAPASYRAAVAGPVARRALAMAVARAAGREGAA